MKELKLSGIKGIVMAGIMLMGCVALVNAQQLAFPSAEGQGKYTVGGRGGKVYEVTNLNDNGPGSLRAAVEAVGPRTVVFRVSGTIILNSTLRIDNPFITIAGQTAPGEGICIRRYNVSVNTHDVIIRYLRVRLGDESGGESDAMGGRYQSNIIVDHCSLSWSVDETMSFYWCGNTTIQWCIISESLYNSNHPKGSHGYGAIWGGENSTYHHNLFAHHSSRNPRFASGSGNTDYRNNVIYNWGFNSAYGGEYAQPGDPTKPPSAVNIVANYYKSGPGTRAGSVRYKIIQPSSRDYLNDYGDWYVDDNYVNGYPNVTSDNWSGGVQPDDNTQLVRDSIRAGEPSPFVPIVQQTAEEAYQLVLEHGGATLPHRDPVDERIIYEVSTGTATYGTGTYNADNNFGDKPTGILDSQEDVGGWPMLYSAPAPSDRDHDGMPDRWETDHGLNPDDPDDRNLTGEGGYTNLEICLNSITSPSVFLYPPVNVTAELASVTSVVLSWDDINEIETGFRIERAEGDTGSFVTAGEVDAGLTNFRDTLLKELTLYRYRVIAFNDTMESVYDGIVEITTIDASALPLPVSNIYPENNADEVVTSPVLTWKASINANNYDIYFGNVDPPPFQVSQADPHFETGELEKGKKYYWRIDGANLNGTTEGQVWNFTVKPEIAHGQFVLWKLDENKGVIAHDAGDYQMDGTLINMDDEPWTAGIIDGGLYFDGVDDYVKVPHSGIIDFGRESFSISAWIMVDELSGSSEYVINKGTFAKDGLTGATGKWYGIEIKNNELRFAIDDDETKTQATINDVSTLILGKWAHIAAVRDTTEKILKLYINGIMRSGAQDGTGSISQVEYLCLGNSTTFTAPFKGILDDVSLYNYALSDEEVMTLYNNVTGIEKVRTIPDEGTFLEQNYPNPFYISTKIGYTVPYQTRVNLSVYDMVGNRVAEIIEGERPAGRFEAEFDAKNLESGIYIYRMTFDDSMVTRRMVLLK